MLHWINCRSEKAEEKDNVITLELGVLIINFILALRMIHGTYMYMYMYNIHMTLIITYMCTHTYMSSYLIITLELELGVYYY